MRLGEVTVVQRDILTHGKRQSQDRSISAVVLCVGDVGKVPVLLKGE